MPPPTTRWLTLALAPGGYSVRLEVAGLGKHPAHDRLEMLERQRLVGGVEAVLVVDLAELGAVVEPLVAAKALAGIGILARGAAVVELLEDPVVLDDPADPRLDVGPQDRRDHLAVGVGGELVADVVQEGSRDVLLAALVAECPGRRLQRVLQTRDLVAAEGVLERSDGREQPIGQPAEVVLLEAVEQLIILRRALGHAGEADGSQSGSSIGLAGSHGQSIGGFHP